MGTPFVSLLKPTRLDNYIRGIPHDKQPANMPKQFCDAMEVRETVFVKEQGVPLENEFDADDSRACHWISYASVRKVVEQDILDADGNILKPRRSVTLSIPIGTIRLVPFPHAPHPRDGGVYWDGQLKEEKVISNALKSPEAKKSPLKVDGTAGAAEYVGVEMRRFPLKPFAGRDRATEMHNGVEAYVKLGRLAVIEEFRGHRIAKLLVTTALAWMKKNPSYFDPSIKKMEPEEIGTAMLEEVPKWRGLVCVHAQTHVVKMWEKMGFTVDQGMGTWWEEGIEHKGMFLRLVPDPPPLTPSII